MTLTEAESFIQRKAGEGGREAGASGAGSSEGEI